MTEDSLCLPHNSVADQKLLARMNIKITLLRQPETDLRQ